MASQEPEELRARELNDRLVEQLKVKGGIKTPAVEAAFRSVLRSSFVPEVPLEAAFADAVVQVKKDERGYPISTSSQPSIMAVMLEQLCPGPGDAVLEVGAGSGYNAALLAYMVGPAGRVVTVDIEEDLAERARERLREAGLENVQVICADGARGFADGAPYDRVILTAAATEIEPAWVEQLKDDGRMVLPFEIVGEKQLSIPFEKEDDHLASRSASACGFMPLRGHHTMSGIPLERLDPRGQVLIAADEKLPAEAATIREWLAAGGRDRDTGVTATAMEVFGALDFWLRLRGVRLRSVHERPAAEGQCLVPPLLIHEAGGPWQNTTLAFVGSGGIAFLARQADRSACEDPDVGKPIRLRVRWYGPDGSSARRLTEAVSAWQDAGRPSPEGLQILAYPKPARVAASGDEFVVEKQHTTLLLRWPQAGR